MSKKLDPHKREIEMAVCSGMSRRKLAEHYGVAKSTMDDFVKTLNLGELAQTLPAKAKVPTGPVDELELAQHELRELRALVKKQRTTDVQAERVLAEVRAAVDATDVKYEAPEAAEGDGKHHVQALLLSDLHGGEVVTHEGTDGMNEFNWEVLLERMASIQRSLYSYQNNRPYPIDELQLWLLGDMCSGSNHKELAETNEFNAAEQGFKIGMLLGQWIESLVEHYPRLVVYGVPGNHPRLQQKPANKNVFDNFDWMAYKVAQTFLREYDTIEWHIPNGGFVVADIAGLNYLLFHGDGIRSSMPGVPWGGVMRRVAQLKAQYAQRGVHLDGFALGHFHQACVVDGILMNGSVKGVDEYSIKNFGSGQKPTQLLATFLPEKRRMTDVSFINP